MSWKLVGNPKTCRVTKNIAKEFSEMEAAIHDRPLSERRMQVYERIIRGGGFRPVSWAKAYCTETGQTYRVNGKHTSTVMHGIADDLPELYAVIEVYECDTLEDVAKLYATYDSKMQSRTAGDINASFASCVKGLGALPGRTINLIVSAISYADFQDTYSQIQAADRAERLLECSDFALWASGIIGDRKKETAHLWRIAVVAAMKRTYDRKKSDATEFWEAVRDDTDPKPNQPTRKLSRFLLTHNPRNGAHTQHRFKVSAREFFVKSLHAWNAWKTDETTALNYYAKAGIPDIK